jgi:hypothetical protein
MITPPNQRHRAATNAVIGSAPGMRALSSEPPDSDETLSPSPTYPNETRVIAVAPKMKMKTRKPASALALLDLTTHEAAVKSEKVAV